MQSRLAAAALAASVAGCGDAITLEIASDRPVPSAIDAICVGVADASLTGGQFGKLYRLEDKLATLPQTLRLEAGGADSAWTWVRADRGGVPVVLAGSPVDFAGDVTLALDRCVRGPANPPTTIGAAAGPAGARLAASQGAGGTVIVAVGASSEVLDARSGALISTEAPPPRAGAVVAVVAADLDGDCDDDLIVATSGAPPALWRRDGVSFTDVGSLGGSAVAAVAAADVDRDGFVDLVTGAGATLSLFRNDGSGRFTRDAAALAGASRVSAVSAIALGDLDGDGNPDLIVGQTNAPLRGWVGEPGGTGLFIIADAVVPPVPLDVVRLGLADADGDFDPDLVVAIRAAPMRLYIDRDGHLEDQSFVRLPQPAPTAAAIAVGGWEESCEPDAVIASSAGAPMLRGTPGKFANDVDAPSATDAVLADIDDDGDLDAILAGTDGVTWLAR